MKLETLEQIIAETNTALKDIRAAKGHDYSGEADTLANVRKHGIRGILIRLSDKLMRLENLCGDDVVAKVQDESIDDTMFDMINYLYIAVALREEEASKTIADEPLMDAFDAVVDDSSGQCPLTKEGILSALQLIINLNGDETNG